MNQLPWRWLAARRAQMAAAIYFMCVCLMSIIGCTASHVDPPTGFAQEKPALGELAPDFVLKDIDGESFHLKDFVGKHPIVIEFGSTTCPFCTQSGLDRREALADRYQGRVEFAFVYCREAHPDHPFGSMQVTSGPNPSQTANWPDRAKRARAFRKQFKIKRRVLVDEMGEQSVQRDFGNRDSEIVVLDEAGHIILKQQHADTKELEDFLEQHCQ